MTDVECKSPKQLDSEYDSSSEAKQLDKETSNITSLAAVEDNYMCKTVEELSKRQLKKLEKRKQWLADKPKRKAKEKEKRKLKIQRAKETNTSLGPSRKLLKATKMADSACKLRICFDMSFADLMTDAEFSKTLKQLNRCYALNRRAEAPLQIYITSYNEKTEAQMKKLSGCFNWDVNFNPAFYVEVLGKEDTVYLTSDSPNVLEDLDHSKAYVIGALVDHNRLKNVSFEGAEKAGVGHARFPLDLYFKFKTRKVLTIDQVYLILLRLTEGKSWVDSVMDTVPKRKGVEPCINVEKGLKNGQHENIENANDDSSNEL